jgi:AraC-like DNA-binding protein/ligand-binding sensor protein
MIAQHDIGSWKRSPSPSGGEPTPEKRILQYEALAKLPVVRESEETFQKLTGVALKLIPAGMPAGRHSLGTHENPFCRLLSGSSNGALACWKFEANVLRQAASQQTPISVCCFSGLHLVAVPVVVDGQHCATWVSGQVVEQRPTPEKTARIVEHLVAMGVTIDRGTMQETYQNTPVVTGDQIAAMKRLLVLLAAILVDHARPATTDPSEKEPPCVVSAKEFVQAHLDERLTLKQIAAVVNLSPFHFSRIFRRATQRTLWQYITHLRLERAKVSLSNPFLRVSEIAYASGFGSIPQFNAVFRRQMGMSPTEYRDSLQVRIAS